MKIQIEFYSKEALAIQIDRSGNMSFPQMETSELFLFTIYTLRQLKNLGQHLVAKCLAGLLVSDKSYYQNLIGQASEIPTAHLLLGSRNLHIMMSQPNELTTEQLAPLSMRLSEETYSINPAYIEIFDRDYASKLPSITKFRGRGKKSLLLTFPPLHLDRRGFGIFVTDANYYAFHSVIGLIRYLLLKHKNDDDFLENLYKVGMYCANFHIYDRIPLDQATLAIAILETAGISIN